MTSADPGADAVTSPIGGTKWSVVTCVTAYLLGTALGDNPIAALVLATMVSTFAVAAIFVLIRRHRARRPAPPAGSFTPSG